MAGKRGRKKGYIGLFIKLSVIIPLVVGIIFVAMVAYFKQGINISAHDLTLEVGTEVRAEDFIDGIGGRRLQISFVETPKEETGSQTVHIIVSNEMGMKKEFYQMLTYYVPDTTPPVINGVKDIVVAMGESVSYLEGVFAHDETDGFLPVNVEKANVNTKVEGIYDIFYWVSDSRGNVANASAKVIVTQTSHLQLQVYEMADMILSQIIDDSMSVSRKLQVIFNYTFDHMGYSGIRLGSDWDSEAMAGLSELIQKGNCAGDCHTFTAISNALLERIGVDIVIVERMNHPTGTTHFWLKVNAGTGWYNYDITNHNEDNGFICFMSTDEELAEFNRLRPEYYSFDKNIVPESPKVPFVVTD